MNGRADAGPWYHGSPHELTELHPGSTITRDRALAKAFSHKPSLVSDGRAEPGGALRHDGRVHGWLYVVAEPVRAADVVPVSGSTMAAGQEWHARRTLRVTMIERTAADPSELLSPEEVEALRRRHGA